MADGSFHFGSNSTLNRSSVMTAAMGPACSLEVMTYDEIIHFLKTVRGWCEEASNNVLSGIFSEILSGSQEKAGTRKLAIAQALQKGLVPDILAGIENLRSMATTYTKYHSDFDRLPKDATPHEIKNHEVLTATTSALSLFTQRRSETVDAIRQNMDQTAINGTRIGRQTYIGHGKTLESLFQNIAAYFVNKASPFAAAAMETTQREISKFALGAQSAIENTFNSIAAKFDQKKPTDTYKAPYAFVTEAIDAMHRRNAQIDADLSKIRKCLAVAGVAAFAMVGASLLQHHQSATTQASLAQAPIVQQKQASAPVVAADVDAQAREALQAFIHSSAAAKAPQAVELAQAALKTGSHRLTDAALQSTARPDMQAGDAQTAQKNLSIGLKFEAAHHLNGTIHRMMERDYTIVKLVIKHNSTTHAPKL